MNEKKKIQNRWRITEIKIFDSHAEVGLAGGKTATIDVEDIDKVKNFRWYARGGRYACNYDGATTTYMHHSILPKKKGMHLDHKNGDGLDNRKINLRYATVAENGRNRSKQKNNTSGYKGVTLYKPNNKWRAQIWVAKKKIYLGEFLSPEEAKKAYLTASKKYHKSFAHQ